MASMSLRSKARKLTAPPWPSPAAMAQRSSSLSVRAMAIARYPAAASVVAIASPIPRLPPVTTTLRIGTHQFPGRGNLQCRHDANAHRYLVRRQVTTARLQNLALHQLLGLRSGGRALDEHDLRRHDGPGDRAAASLDERSAHAG